VRREVHCHAVDAVALMGGRRTVIEDVPKMAATCRTVHLGPYHAEAFVDRYLDAAGDRLVEARPAGAAFELAARLEQCLAAAGAGELAGPLLDEQGAAAGHLGAML